MMFLQLSFAQQDEGYESGNESYKICTSLSRALRIYHVSMVEDLSFNPKDIGQSPTTPEQACSPHLTDTEVIITCHQLVFISSDDKSPVRPSEQCSQHSSTDDRSHNPMGVDASSSIHCNLCLPIIPTPTANPFLTNAWG